jgi:hypothetical protein
MQAVACVASPTRSQKVIWSNPNQTGTLLRRLGTTFTSSERQPSLEATYYQIHCPWSNAGYSLRCFGDTPNSVGVASATLATSDPVVTLLRRRVVHSWRCFVALWPSRDVASATHDPVVTLLQWTMAQSRRGFGNRGAAVGVASMHVDLRWRCFIELWLIHDGASTMCDLVLMLLWWYAIHWRCCFMTLNHMHGYK